MESYGIGVILIVLVIPVFILIGIILVTVVFVRVVFFLFIDIILDIVLFDFVVVELVLRIDIRIKLAGCDIFRILIQNVINRLHKFLPIALLRVASTLRKMSAQTLSHNTTRIKYSTILRYAQAIANLCKKYEHPCLFSEVPV